MMRRPAVFLDRDDTLIVDSGFIDHPDKVELMPGAARAVQQFHELGFKVVVATNQSGIARGLFDEQRLAEINSRMQSLLRDQDAKLDGIYHCPFLDGPEAVVPRYRRRSPLRKPAPGMLIKAARDLHLDLNHSWMIGDALRDVEAGRAAGCRTILIAPEIVEYENGRVRPDFRVSSLAEAVAIVEQHLKKPTKSARNDASKSGGVEAKSHPTDSDVAEQTEDSPVEGDTNLALESDTVVSLLAQIRSILERDRRAERYPDFSVFQLIATIVQLLAIVIAVWGVLAMFQSDTPVAMMRFGLAMFLQLVMISLTLADRRK